MRKRKNKPVEVESVQIENNIKSDRELTETQQKDLNKMLDTIDNEVNETEHFIRKIADIKDRYKKWIENGDMTKRITCISLLVISTLVLLVYTNYYSEMSSFNKEYEKTMSESTSTLVDIYIDETSKQLICDVSNASILSSNELYTEINNFDWVQSDIDTTYDKYDIDGKECKLNNKTRLNSLILNNTYAYIEYANENNNANKEIIFGSAKPLDIDLVGFNKETLRFFEKSNPIMVKGYVNSFNNSFLMLNETLGGGELSIKTVENEIINIESTMKTSQNNSGFILKVGDIAELNLSKLTYTADSPQVIYKYSDGVIRVSNKETNSDCLYMYSIHNNVMGLNPEDLLKTELENMFIHKQFDSEESNGFCTFAIISNNDIYCFKAINRDIVHEVLEQFGMDSSKLTIGKIQSVIKTQE